MSNGAQERNVVGSGTAAPNRTSGGKSGLTNPGVSSRIKTLFCLELSTPHLNPLLLTCLESLNLIAMEVLSTLSKVLEFTPLGASLHLLDELVQSTLPDYVKSDAAFEQTIDDSVPHALAMFASSDTPVDASTAIKHFTDGMGLDDTQQARIRNTILDNEANVSIVETKIKHLGEHVLTVYRAFSQIIVLSGDFERWQTGNPPTSGVSVQPTRSTSNDNAVSLRQVSTRVVRHL